MNRKIDMVDLHSQYLRLKPEIDEAMQTVIDKTSFINGPQVTEFAGQLAAYLDVPYVIPCGNGTDALQIALMSLGLKPGDEVIVPAFTYIAAAEVLLLLGLRPVLVDVDPYTFNIDIESVEEAIGTRTKAIIAVHLFGQCCDMEPLMKLAACHHIFVIEDNAQSIGADYRFADGTVQKAGTIGYIGTTSFFPSKPLACYGDGGAMMTPHTWEADMMRMIANHGQSKKYHHQEIGCNSRLDTLQAAILLVKLKYMDRFTEARREVAARYDMGLKGLSLLKTPVQAPYSTHVYHQYTIQVYDGKRDELKAYLQEKGIPSMIYYPLPVHHQEAFEKRIKIPHAVLTSNNLCERVLSLPIHTEMTEDQQDYIIETIRDYAKR